MRLMYICGMYCPSYGGAEIRAYNILKYLKEELGWEVVAITDSRYSSTKRNMRFNKVKIKTVNHRTRVKEIEKAIMTFNPDAILTHLVPLTDSFL